jgi:hypothetical protein
LPAREHVDGKARGRSVANPFAIPSDIRGSERGGQAIGNALFRVKVPAALMEYASDQRLQVVSIQAVAAQQSCELPTEGRLTLCQVLMLLAQPIERHLNADYSAALCGDDRVHHAMLETDMLGPATFEDSGEDADHPQIRPRGERGSQNFQATVDFDLQEVVRRDLGANFGSVNHARCSSPKGGKVSSQLTAALMRIISPAFA